MKPLVTPAMAALMLIGAAPCAGAAEPADRVSVAIDKWRKPGSNNIGTADITITNDNDFAVKDIRVRCDYMAKTGGRKIETEQNIAVTVKAKSTKVLRKTRFPFIDTAETDGACKVRSAAPG
jgi:hypothetical protein